jgi:tRNA modification GTPase
VRLSAAESDTIAAIATPPGESGLAVIRISGPRATAVADQVFCSARKPPTQLATAPSHTLHYGHIVREGRRLDEVLVAIMRAPRTFTREDVVEVSCHGGVLVTRLVLDALLAAGARAAQPGEFSRRAFLNGRLDLTQAEAVADVIHARTELALAAAQEQLAGSLSRRVGPLRDELLGLLAHVEAHIDFPDEDIAPDTRDRMTARLESALSTLDGLLATAREGQVLRRGIRTVIVGCPNAGKSSLLNRLLGHDRAIVSPVAGTTRDTIEETASIRGYPVVFIDTAGLRDAADDLEREGIRRTRKAADRAELVLHVLDGSDLLQPADLEFLGQFADKPRLLVLNKSDLPRRLELPAGTQEAEPVPVSCVTGEGLETLKEAIAGRIRSGATEALPEATINARHEDALRRAREGLDRTRTALVAELGLELVALDLRIAVTAIGEIVGGTATDDLLDSIFSQFCLGK